MKAAGLFVCSCLLTFASAMLIGEEDLAGPPLGSEIWKSMQDWERHELQKCDVFFGKREWLTAAAAYDAYSKKFPRSKAMAYCLLRQGRCYDMDNKRNEAIKLYREVFQYFTDEIPFAAHALHYWGIALEANQDFSTAIKVFSTYNKPEYEQLAKQPIAAVGLMKIAHFLSQNNKRTAAIEQYWKIGVTFRQTNPKPAFESMGQVSGYYIRESPNEEKLRQFYVVVMGFSREPIKVSLDIKELVKDWTFWSWVLTAVQQNGNFDVKEKELSDKYWEYWLKILDGKFKEVDEYQLTLARLELARTKDKEKWAKKVDAQFLVNWKDGDFLHILRWMKEYGKSEPEKVKEYFQKIKLEALKMPELKILFEFFYDDFEDKILGDMALSKYDPSYLSEDPDRVSLVKYLWTAKRNWLKASQFLKNFNDTELATIVLLRILVKNGGTRNPPGVESVGEDKGDAVSLVVETADKLKTSKRFMQEAMWTKGSFLDKRKLWAEAIPAYQAAAKGAESGYAVAECLANLGRFPEAISEVQAIETVLRDTEGPKAAWIIAQYYNRANNIEEYKRCLLTIIEKYPGSESHRNAHVICEQRGWLEKRGGIEAKKTL